MKCHMHHALINCAMQFARSTQQNATIHMVRPSFLTWEGIFSGIGRIAEMAKIAKFLCQIPLLF